MRLDLLVIRKSSITFEIVLQNPSSFSNVQFSHSSVLKGYSSVSLIHVLTHLDMEYDPPLRDKVCGLLVYVVLASSETTAWQQYTAVNRSKYKTAIKKPQIMLRTAPNFSNITNRVPAHISMHQTFDTECSRVLQLSEYHYYGTLLHSVIDSQGFPTTSLQLERWVFFNLFCQSRQRYQMIDALKYVLGPPSGIQLTVVSG